MSREKQIEEIFNDMIEAENRFHEHCLSNVCHDCEYYGDGECDNHIKAEFLYNAGYRKQEWIRVDERLPEPSVECLVTAKVGNRMVVDLGERVLCFDYRTKEHNYEWSMTNDWDEGEGCEITHWMPLPEAPKMKGENK